MFFQFFPKETEALSPALNHDIDDGTCTEFAASKLDRDALSGTIPPPNSSNGGGTRTNSIQVWS